ncbi:MAG: hypothetical protein SGARI_007963 [Bacillariaceae sp.]
MYSDTVGIGAYERDVYFITKTIGGRCILVEGPGVDYIQMDKKVVLESLEATLKMPKNDIPTNVAEGFRRALKKLGNYLTSKRFSSRRLSYYLFCYPPGTRFDNTAISGEGAAESIKTFGVKINSKFSIFSKNNHLNIMCFWAIATEADEDRRTNDFNATLSSDIFDM